MQDLVFEKESHSYFVKGKNIASVTQVIQKAGLIDTQWFTDFARDRGSAVHEAIHLDIHNNLFYDGLHEVIKPYVDAWLKFKKDTRAVPILRLCEKPQYNPIYGYVGTPDYVGTLNSRYVLIDYKTGASPVAHIQTAAYSRFPEIMPYMPERYSLRLFNDGKYKLIPHKDENDFLVFLDCLQKIKAGK